MCRLIGQGLAQISTTSSLLVPLCLVPEYVYIYSAHLYRYIMCNTVTCTRQEIHVCVAPSHRHTKHAKGPLSPPPLRRREICPQTVRGSPTHMPNERTTPSL